MRRAIVLLVLLVLGSCGDSQEAAGPDETDQASPGTAAVQECADRTPPAPAKEDEPGKSKPDLDVPDGAPPCELVVQDIYVGTGAEAKEGATVTVQYVGVSWSSGDEFDSSWSRGEPATFPLGQVIQGWQEGIPGMKEGGRRRLIIPPDLAYADRPPPGIAPNETLVFVIDLIKGA